jgi:hypothetical protein
MRPRVVLLVWVLLGGSCTWPWERFERAGDAMIDAVAPDDSADGSDVADGLVDAGSDVRDTADEDAAVADAPDSDAPCLPCMGHPCGGTDRCGAPCDSVPTCDRVGVFTVPYAALDPAAGCAASTRASIACDAAALRWCVAHGWQAGFGPVDDGSDSTRLQIVCLAQPAQTIATTPETLSTYQTCLASDLYTVECESASARFCTHRDAGFSAGFGVLGYSSPTNGATVACVTGGIAHLHTIMPSALSAADPSCTDYMHRSPGCNRAAFLACVAAGALAGVGPVEYTAAPDASLSLYCFQ